MNEEEINTMQTNKINVIQMPVGACIARPQNAITLIALIITIIILLILAGVTINAILGDNGLFKTAETSAKAYKIAEVEEKAGIYYISETANQIAENKKATLTGVIKNLRKDGYIIKEETNGTKEVKEIKLSEKEITLTMNQTHEIIYEIVYEENALSKYYIQIQGAYYAIRLEEGTIKIDRNENQLKKEEQTEETKEEVIINSSNESIVTIQKEEEKITLTAKSEIGTAEIIVEYKGKIGKCIVNVGIPCTGISINPTSVEIEEEESSNITITVEPINTTDVVTYKVANEKIAKIENGTITGLEAGTTLITVTCGKITETCEVNVTAIPDGIRGTVKTHTAKALDYTWEELNAVAEMISDNYGSGENQVKNRTVEVTVKVNGKKYTVGVGDTAKLGGKKVRILGFNHDKLSSATAYGENKTNTYAGISFEYINPIITDLGTFSDWESSLIRTELNSTILNNLENKQYVKQVKKECRNGISEDYLWFLSASEIWSDYSDLTNGYKEGERYIFYANLRKGLDHQDDTTQMDRSGPAWTRSNHWAGLLRCEAGGKASAGLDTADVCPGFAI